MTGKLILYSYFRSGASYRVRIALNIKKIDFEYVAVHLLKEGGQQHKQEYKKLNPASQVPTLIDGDFVLSESMAILDYLDQIQPSPRLFPADHKSRAKVLQFCELINSGIQPLGNLKVTQYLEKKFPEQKNLRQDWIQKWVGDGLQTIEEFLNQNAGEYCFKNELSAADVLLVPQIFSALRFGLTLDKYTLVKKHYEKLIQLSEFEKAHPSIQPDAE